MATHTLEVIQLPRGNYRQVTFESEATTRRGVLRAGVYAAPVISLFELGETLSIFANGNCNFIPVRLDGNSVSRLEVFKACKKVRNFA